MATRRSTRERKPAVSIYDDAKEELKRSPPKSGRGDPKNDDNDNDDDASVLSDLLKDDSSSSSEAFEAPKRTKRRSPKRIHVRFKQQQKPSKKGAAKKKKAVPKGPNKTRALESLRHRTLDPRETPANSLTAAILMACTPPKKNTKKKVYESDDDDDTTTTRYPDAFVPTPYTPLLEPVVQQILAQDTNQAHVSLLNLVFRCVGGSFETLLPDECVLEDMDDDQWEQVVTSIVDDMRRTAPDSILLCADEKGAVHANSNDKKHNAAQEEFRRIYDHFWYLLGTLALSNVTTGGVDTTTAKKKATSSSSSFDIERVRDLASRMIELVTVGQPDLRAAACVAALQLAAACCDGTLALGSRLATTTRQWKAAQAAQTETKEKALHAAVAALDRASSDLQQVVVDTIMAGVFMRRYRDSDPHIRALCLRALCQLSLTRPDIFLQDIYLKYYGWMMSDKEAIVRVAALEGLWGPFQRADEQSRRNESTIHPLQMIHIGRMDKVIEKFLPRIADCVIDVNTSVQEQAMELLLTLMRQGLLDDVEDNNVWNQINLRALAENTTPKVRRDALYFVLEQLEAYDSNSPLLEHNQLTERQKVFQIDSLAAWVAHALSDGDAPLDSMRVYLTDFVVQSLRDMPRHAHLTTDWSAMLHAIQQDIEADHQQERSQRSTIAKQRVLLRMLVCSASIALDGSENYHDDDDNDNGELPLTDPDFLRVQAQLQSTTTKTTAGGKKKHSKSESSTMVHESLTVGLLKALPKLLPAFKGDMAILRCLTRLPKFLIISGITLPQRKYDVQALTNLLGEIFLESTDTTVLQNTCLALSVLARGNHSRNQEAFLKLQDVAKEVQNRLYRLYQQTPSSAATVPKKNASTSHRRSPRSPATRSTQSTEESLLSQPQSDDDDEEEDRVLDQQHAILLCLTRLRILSKKWYLGDLLAREPAKSQDESTMEEMDTCVNLCSTIAKAMAKELKSREIQLLDGEEENLKIPEFWATANPKVHYIVANSVREGLDVILALTAWRLQGTIKRETAAKELQKRLLRTDDSDDDDDEKKTMELDDATVYELDMETKMVVRMRDGLVKLLGLCFDQFLDDEAHEEDGLTKEHVAFATNVQLNAGRVSGDLRTLFPKGWVDAASPILRACALMDDSHLIGGNVRFFRAKEEELASAEMGKTFKEVLLLPLSRSLCSGWVGGNRREAGTALAHIAHPSEEASKAVGALSRVLKKIDPVRLLEAHMASLRQCHADWMDSEPEEPESDHPTEEEMDEFAAAEVAHADAFKLLEHKAHKLAHSLGVGKLSEKKLYPALFGFVKEGIRFAFSHSEADGDDEYHVGSRLSFLRIVMKYFSWIKKMKTHLKNIQQFFVEKEAELRSHPDFDEVRDEDIDAMDLFRKGLGLTKEKSSKKRKRRSSVSTLDLDDDEDSFMASPASHGSRRRISQAGSVFSQNLSPIHEAGSSDDDEDNVPIEKLKKRKTSLMSQATIQEGSDEDDGSRSQPGRKDDECVDEDDDSMPIQSLKKRLTSPLSQATTLVGTQEEEASRGSASSASMEM